MTGRHHSIGASSSPCSLDKLRADLLQAQDVLRTDPRQGAKIALSVLIDFLDCDPEWAKADVSLPIWSLLAALESLDKGRVVPMLAPHPALRHRAPDSEMRQIVRAYAVYTVDRLRAAGWSIEKACREVANILTDLGVPVGGAVKTPDWKVVQGWRSRMSKRDPKHDQDRLMLDALRGDADLSSVPRGTAAVVALDNLSSALGKLGKTVLD